MNISFPAEMTTLYFYQSVQVRNLAGQFTAMVWSNQDLQRHVKSLLLLIISIVD